MLRTLTERALRSTRFVRRLPAAFDRRPVVVSPGAGLRFAFRPARALDPQLLRFAREFVSPGAHVWDIGANVGLFTVAASHCAGPNGSVLALEPDTWLVELLRKTSRLNAHDSMAPIEVVPAAIGQELALRQFAIANRSRATNHLVEYGTSQTGGTRFTETVVTLSLDWLAQRRPPPTCSKSMSKGRNSRC